MFPRTICLLIQLITEIILRIHYTANIYIAFERIILICRSVHANGASLFFIYLKIHIGWGLYYSPHSPIHTWIVGIIFFITLATAFLGYVLPRGPLSVWGVTIITK